MKADVTVKVVELLKAASDEVARDGTVLELEELAALAQLARIFGASMSYQVIMMALVDALLRQSR